MSACSRWASRAALSYSERVKSIMAVGSLQRRHGVEHRDRAGVPVPHLDRVVADESMAAEDLEAVVRELRDLALRVDLRERGLLARIEAVLEIARGLPDQPAHRVGLDLHVGEPERDRLLLRDRLSERFALLRVRDREL